MHPACPVNMEKGSTLLRSRENLGADGRTQQTELVSSREFPIFNQEGFH